MKTYNLTKGVYGIGVIGVLGSFVQWIYLNQDFSQFIFGLGLGCGILFAGWVLNMIRVLREDVTKNHDYLNNKIEPMLIDIKNK